MKAENSKLPAAEAEKIIRLPENEWTMTPKKVMAYADFMSRVKVWFRQGPRAGRTCSSPRSTACPGS